MNTIEMKMPSPGESITEVEIAALLVKDGEYVQLDQPIAEIDSDKATLELNAEASGIIRFKVKEGQTIKVGDPVCIIDTSASPPPSHEKKSFTPKEMPLKESTPKQAASSVKHTQTNRPPSTDTVKATPLAEEMIRKNQLSGQEIQGSGKRGKIWKKDVLDYLASDPQAQKRNAGETNRNTIRKKLSPLRKKLSQRLVSVKNQTAMLTTFNEVDMSAIISVRNKYKTAFEEQYGTSLGFMSFFTKACAEALHIFPSVNAMIDGDEIVYHNYADIGIAVSAPKGLMVPVLRNADQMTFAEIEKDIKRLAAKAREGKISLDEMKGGTFTITNGGVFGSLFSTPIINPPQSAILGMHNIVERPVAIKGTVLVRPMMYVALSYDHRVIDGKESVGFLYAVKEMLEQPVSILFGGKQADAALLGL